MLFLLSSLSLLSLFLSSVTAAVCYYDQPTDRGLEEKADIETDRQTDRQRDRERDRQTDRQTDRGKGR